MSETCLLDKKFLQAAIRLAKKALALGEVPIGAVMVYNNKIIARGFNKRETRADPFGHAEMEVIGKAARKLGRWRLTDCTLYVTLEPCVMCAGAIVQARIGRVVYGAKDPKGGAAESIYSVLSDRRLNHRPEVCGNVLSEDCGRILKDFFAELRKASRQKGIRR